MKKGDIEKMKIGNGLLAGKVREELELEIIENTGHYKILTEVFVMDKIVKFLKTSDNDQ